MLTHTHTHMLVLLEISRMTGIFLIVIHKKGVDFFHFWLAMFVVNLLREKKTATQEITVILMHS